MFRPKVSIIIPVYNVSLYVERCLDSVLRQNYDNLEVIVVDDCGTDNSMQIVRDFILYHGLHNFKLVKHEYNRGLSAARNTGLSVANGDYVYFLDSDDSIADDAISSLVEPLKKKEYDFVIGDYSLIGSYGSSDLRTNEGEIIGNNSVLKSYANGLWYVMAWNKLCKRHFLLEHRLFFEEGCLHEDVIWSFKLACKTSALFVVKKSIYNYFVRESSIMTDMSIEKDVKVYIEAFRKIVAFMKEDNRTCGIDEYRIIEGKKSGIMYSLLQKKEYDIYNKYYSSFYDMCYISPIRAYREGMISLGYVLRDFHYCLPKFLGRLYKRLFYNVVYAWRGRQIEGAVWK